MKSSTDKEALLLLTHLIEFVYRLLWGDLFMLPVGGGIGISLMVVLLFTAGIWFTLRTRLLARLADVNGKTVFVDHGNGLISMVCHLDRIDVQAGDPVSQGQRIGLSGMTGRASGPHLHWSMVLNGVMVDPALFIERAP